MPPNELRLDAERVESLDLWRRNTAESRFQDRPRMWQDRRQNIHEIGLLVGLEVGRDPSLPKDWTLVMLGGMLRCQIETVEGTVAERYRPWRREDVPTVALLLLSLRILHAGGFGAAGQRLHANLQACSPTPRGADRRRRM